MATIYKLKDAPNLQNRNIFVDANVLIYCFWEAAVHGWEQSYARALSVLLHQNSALFVDFSVISEVVNRVLRIEHQKLRPLSKFKTFRDSDEGKNALSDIFLTIKQNILPKFNVISKSFDKEMVERLLVVDDLDFVDKSTVEICKENSLILLTNDKDFRNAEIDILTDNPNILR
jgi:predicted nucleic acid-binding protein